MKNNQRLLFNVYWAFYQKTYPSKEAFNQAIQEYYDDFGSLISNTWRPDEIVYHQPTIKLFFNYFHFNESEVPFELTSENCEYFTALDLMYQLNNYLAQYELIHHYFFEGLQLNARDNRYHIHLGS